MGVGQLGTVTRGRHADLVHRVTFIHRDGSARHRGLSSQAARFAALTGQS